MSERSHPFPGNQLRTVELDPELDPDAVELDAAIYGDTPEIAPGIGSANLVTSEFRDGLHRLVIDVDHPLWVLPSSTPGHGHLYVDVPMTWFHAVDILEAMSEAGVVEPGYVASSKARGYTAVRLPWVSKGARAAT